ncbi:MAG TPA: hypothetical protein V6D11_03400 [Waterburya sp.]
MSSQPKSQMIRVPTPLIHSVRELARLHRIGRTKAVLEGVVKLVAAIDSEEAIDIDSVSDAISQLTSRLERLESQKDSDDPSIDIAQMTLSISDLTERMEKVESDIHSIALTLTDLNVRLADIEGVGDIGYAVSSISALESLDDSESIAEESLTEATEAVDITSDSVSIAISESPPKPLIELTQSNLAKRLGCSVKLVERHRKQGKESFAAWSQRLDPDGLSWRWSGRGVKGNPLRFRPTTTKEK